MATRSNSRLTVVSSATTSYRGSRRSACSVNAESLPLLQESIVFNGASISTALPCRPFAAEVKLVRVQDLGEDLRAFRQPRPGAVEVLVSIREIDLAAQRHPSRIVFDEMEVALDLCDVEAARHDDQHVGIGGDELFPRQ